MRNEGVGNTGLLEQGGRAGRVVSACVLVIVVYGAYQPLGWESCKVTTAGVITSRCNLGG